MYGNTKERDFLLGALTGGAIAVLTTLLFTTKKGIKIKDKICDVFEDMEESAKEHLSESKEAVKSTASEAKDKAEEEAEHIRKKAHESTKSK